MSRHRLSAPRRRRKCSLAGRHSLLPSCIGTATESRDDPSASGSSEVVDFFGVRRSGRRFHTVSSKVTSPVIDADLARRGSRHRSALAISGIHKVLQFLARLKKRNLFRRHFHFFPGFRVSPHATPPFPSAEAPKSANLDLFPFLQRPDNAVKDSLDDALRLLPRQFRNPQHLFYEVGLRQCGLLGHRPVASSLCLKWVAVLLAVTLAHDAKRLRRGATCAPLPITKTTRRE